MNELGGIERMNARGSYMGGSREWDVAHSNWAVGCASG